jgi:hypothetical protein
MCSDFNTFKTLEHSSAPFQTVKRKAHFFGIFIALSQTTKTPLRTIAHSKPVCCYEGVASTFLQT